VSPATTGHTVELGDVTPDGRYLHFGRTYAHPTRTVSYVLDRTTGERTRSSYKPDGRKGFGRAGAISDDGRIVSFGGYTRNMETGKVQDVLVSPSGTPRSRTSTEIDLSASGRYVTFSGYPKRGTRVDGEPARVQIWRHNRATGRTKLVTAARGGGLADGASRDAAMSANGRYVAFVSNARNLTRGDGGPTYNVYLRDMRTGRTTLASRAASGTRAAVYPGGRYARGDGIALSADARQVAFTSPDRLVPEDTDRAADVYVRSLDGTGSVALVSAGTTGGQSSAYAQLRSASTDGRFVVFRSDDATLDPTDPGPEPGGHLYLRDRGPLT
jgi:Tol biopolymer transport system component